MLVLACSAEGVFTVSVIRFPCIGERLFLCIDKCQLRFDKIARCTCTVAPIYIAAMNARLARGSESHSCLCSCSVCVCVCVCVPVGHEASICFGADRCVLPVQSSMPAVLRCTSHLRLCVEQCRFPFAVLGASFALANVVRFLCHEGVPRWNKA